jgi:putative hemolysin
MDIGLFFVIVLIACLCVSAFFSCLETALTSLSVARTKKLIEDKPLRAKALNLWLKSPNHVITAILVGNNVVNTLSASLATVLAQQYFSNYAISIATFCITLLILVFGEITPKTFARHNAEKIAPIAMTILLPIYLLLLPITLALSYLAAKLVHLSGAKSGPGPVATEEDIAYLIRLGHEEGCFEAF